MKKHKKSFLEIIGCLVFALSAIYAVNQLIFHFSTLKERLYSKNGNYYKHKMGKIFYTKNGSGSPLLLIHNLDNAHSEYEWNAVIKKFSAKHTVYAVDLLGCGRSDKPKMTYTGYLYVQILSDFIQEVICDKPDVIVTGDSVSFTLMIEQMKPHTFGHMILVNPTDFKKASHFPTTFDKYKKELLEMPIIGTLLYNLYYSKASIRKRMQKKYFFRTTKGAFAFLDRLFESSHLKGSNNKYLHASKNCHYLACNINNPNLKIETPVCVLLGDSNDYEEDIREWPLFKNPDTEFEVLPNTKFLPQIETPEKFVSTCESFMEE